jgi:PAS domain S-box-containing protein
MKEHAEPADEWNALRDKIIGLGERSIRKSYYPQLQQHLEEVEKSRSIVEENSAALEDMLKNVQEISSELAESQARYRSLVENINDVIYSADIEGKFTYVSPAIRNLSQYSPEELIGQSFAHCVHPDDLPMVVAGLERVFAGVLEPQEFRLVDKNGEIRYFRTFSRPLMENGQVVGITGVISDINERKLAEETLRKSEQLLSDILDGSPIPQIFVGKDHHVIKWNKAAEQYTGTKAADIIGTDHLSLAFYKKKRPALADLLIEGDLEKIPQWYAGKFAKSQLVEGAYEATDFFPALGPEGKWLHFTASAIKDSSGNIIGAVETLEDVTERKRAEESLRRLNRELRAVSNCNQTLMRAEEEPALLHDVCRIICDEAGYRMAWVGYAEQDDAKTIRPVAWGGVEDGYLADAHFTWDSTERGLTSPGTALRTGETAYLQDITTAPHLALWRENALQRGYRSNIALPLKDANARTFGALTIYSAEPNAFTPSEIRLMEELAGDLAFGISVLRARVELKRAEQDRLTHLRLLESLDSVNRAMQGTSDLQQMIADVLDTLLSIFDCDRAFLVYPCDPEAASWHSVLERTRLEHPSNVWGLEVPMDQTVAEHFTALRASSGPVTFGPGLDVPLPAHFAEWLGIKSVLATAIYPKVDRPYMFGLQQCSRPRDWTPDEKNLFQEISRRLSDGVTSLLTYRNLQASEAKYRHIVDTASEGIWMLGTNGETTFVNARMAEMLGYRSEDMIGQPVAAFLFEEDRLDHDNRIEERRKGQPGHYERRYRRKDGKTVWTLLSATPLLDDKNGFMGSFAMLTDITERKRAEAEREVMAGQMKGVNALQQSLLKAAPLEAKLSGITSGIVQYFNADVCRIWTIRPGDLCELGCMHAEATEGPHVCHQRDKCLHLRANSGRYAYVNDKAHGRVPFGRYTIGQIASGNEHKFLIRDAVNDPSIHNHEWARDLGLVSFAGYQLRVPGGETIGVLALFANHPILPAEDAMLDGLSSAVALAIQQANAEDALRDTERKVRTLVENIPDCIARYDMNSRHLFVNSSVAKTAGIPAEQFIGKSIKELHIAGNDAHDSMVEDAIGQTFKNGVAASLESEWNVPTGTRCFDVLYVAEKDEQGQVASVLSIGHDITDRKLAEQNLHAANTRLEHALIRAEELAIRAESANRAKSEFLATMSHELRTPLNAVIGFSDGLLQRVGLHPLNEHQLDRVRRIKSSGEHLLTLINSVLDISKLEAGKTQINMSEVDITELAHAVAVIAEGLLLRKPSVHLTLDVENEMPTITSDRDKIRQILLNLLGNAIKFTEQGSVSLSIRCLHESHHPRWVQFVVSDTGIGIPLEKTAELFQPFTQVDRAVACRYGGTGLGLCISKRLAIALGGDIEVASELGKGSVFSLRIPLVAPNDVSLPQLLQATADAIGEPLPDEPQRLADGRH